MKKLPNISSNAHNILGFDYSGLKKIISGGQTGADQAGLFAAEEFGLNTGGHMPHGFKTAHGPRVEFGSRFGIEETESHQYPDRTKLNVINSDATLRLASDFTTPGEQLTLRYLNMLKKPHHSVSLLKSFENAVPAVVNFIICNNVSILNIAGNADRGVKTFHFDSSISFLRLVLTELANRNLIVRKS